ASASPAVEDVLDFSRMDLGYDIRMTVDGPLTRVEIFKKSSGATIGTVDAYNVERVIAPLQGLENIKSKVFGILSRNLGVGGGLTAADASAADTVATLTPAQLDQVVQQALDMWRSAGAPV